MKYKSIQGRSPHLLLLLAMLLFLTAGCGTGESTGGSGTSDTVQITGDGGSKSNTVRDAGSGSGVSETVQGSQQKGTRDNTPQVLEPQAEGLVVYANDEVTIDASNLSEGYFMVCYTGSAQKVRMLVDTPEGDTYNYLLPLDGDYAVYPLSDGSGSYSVGVYENISGDKYAEIFSQQFDAAITDENRIFLYPNEYVDFTAESKTVAKGAELAAGADTDLEVVTAVYDYVTQNISYDYDKAENVKSGYLPVVDETLASGTGICFDYASLMAAMLRSQRIPTRLEIGYVDDMYHSWISVYIDEIGWVEDMIYFDGNKWSLMDPTLASYAKDQVVKDHMDNADQYYEIKYKY
jgi:hypothetical protein